MRVECLLIGGFLAAGKTTAMLRLARHMVQQGRRVALITNDQSYGLADTAVATADGYPVEEITGGCFCCRFDALRTAVERLEREAAPDVLLAEPVGSCTDLWATVRIPLSGVFGERYRIGPLTVMIDPERALRVLEVEPGRAFSPKVCYVYTKQLEEADILVMNKSDAVDRARLDRLEAALRELCPRAAVLRMSARHGAGFDEWIAALATDGRAGSPLDVDYGLYADGEGRLGWVNASVRLAGANPREGDAILIELADRIRTRLAGIEIAHLKITLAPADGSGRVGVVNIAGDRTELSRPLACGVAAGELLVNLRAEAPPEVLRDAVAEAVAEAVAGADLLRCEAFRPGPPVPTHRIW